MFGFCQNLTQSARSFTRSSSCSRSRPNVSSNAGSADLSGSSSASACGSASVSAGVAAGVIPIRSAMRRPSFASRQIHQFQRRDFDPELSLSTTVDNGLA
jgi:hypothetical protein